MKKNRKKLTAKQDRRLNIMTLIVLAIMLAVILNVASTMKPYHIMKNEIAATTIRASQTVVDDKKTESEKAAAADNVQDVYTINSNITQNQIDSVNMIFTVIGTVQEDEDKAEQTAKKAKKQFEPFSNQIIVKRARALLNKSELTFEATAISDASLVTLYHFKPSKLTDFQSTLVSVITKQLQKGVTNTQLLNIRAELQLSMNELAIASSLRAVATEIINAGITVNSFYDASVTNQQRLIAQNSVQPVRILQGQVIVQEGQLVTDDIYRQLELVHMVKSSLNWLVLLGNVLMAIVIAIMTFFLVYRSRREHHDVTIVFMIFSALTVLSYLMLLLFRFSFEHRVDNLIYILPVVFVPMILQLLGYRALKLLGILQIVMAAVLILQSSQSTFNIVYFIAYILLSSLGATLILNKPKTRNDLFVDSMYISLFNGAAVFIIQLISAVSISTLSFWWPIFYGMIGGLIAFILSLGLQPLFETIFGVLSPNQLMELASPSQPLLKRMMNEAPGTYHHSLMVANLAEAAVDAIGGDSLYTRVACYYHDVGKMVNPAFFVENQYGDKSPHEQLTATASRDIIIAHAKDGVAMLQAAHFPKPIVDMAEQHHGTTVLRYFYYAAQQEDASVVEATFRYPGPKPQTREIAVVNIADSVEAAVRSMKTPSTEKMADLIHSIVEERLLDGQFDECELSMKDMITIKDTLLKVLVGVYHQRIEYPK